MKFVNLYSFILISLSLFLVLCSTEAFAQSEQADKIYEHHSKSVYQIQIIDIKSDARASIGSGFRIKHNDFVVTNFHVIADAIHEPQRYRIEYINESGEIGILRPLAIDVVHDISILVANKEGKHHLELGNEKILTKGSRIYSMGNPYDLGMMIIEGTYNGYQDDSFYDRVMFSGSLNPGMSGGPGLDINGKVIGVNVAITGNDISYFVPLKYLINLLTEADTRYKELQEENITHIDLSETQTANNDNPESTEIEQEVEKEKPKTINWNNIIQSQLLNSQEEIFDKIINNEWTKVKYTTVEVPKELSSAIPCSGTSHSEDDEYNHSHSILSCESKDYIYVSSSLYTGYIFYYFEDFSSNSLNDLAFNEYYQDQYSTTNLYDGERLEKDTKSFKCKSHFLIISDRKWKAAFCTRKYAKYPKVYDVVFTAALLGEKKHGSIFEIGLGGVSKEMSIKFIDRFVRSIQ
jgi:hypothetical protein